MTVTTATTVRPDLHASGAGRLIHARVDAALAGGLAVAVWAIMYVADRAGSPLPTNRVVFWTAAFVGSMHFAMSYRLAYDGGRPAIQRHPVALLVAPATLLALILTAVGFTVAGSGVAADLLDVGITFVFGLTMWHYVKQTYGVVRLGASLTGFRLTPREALVVRFGLYPLWFVSLVAYLSGRTLADVDGFEVRADLLPGGAAELRTALVVLSGAVLVAVVARASRRQRRWPPMLVTAPLLAGVLWVGLTPDLLLAVVLLPAFHALQYLVVCYPAQQGLLRERDPLAGHRDLVQIFVGAACVGLLATNYLPSVLDGVAGVEGQPALWLIAVFVFLNLHHYLIDATVWRSSGRLVGAVRSARG